jgi:alkanesulfonate monooxygenase SsuD/methylene tetrahydromethanopterin reductase-like flavin-dependent oxidoreductase (luciferase family)
VAKAYRHYFKPGHEEKAHLALAMIALVAESEDEAKLIERAMLMRWVMTAMGANRPVPTLEEAAAYNFSPREEAIAARERPRATIGMVDAVAERIMQVKEEFQADEVVLVAIGPSYELRTRTMTRLAAKFGLLAR